jgi:hypothetical protein
MPKINLPKLKKVDVNTPTQEAPKEADGQPILKKLELPKLKKV